MLSILYIYIIYIYICIYIYVYTHKHTCLLLTFKRGAFRKTASTVVFPLEGGLVCIDARTASSHREVSGRFALNPLLPRSSGRIVLEGGPSLRQFGGQNVKPNAWVCVGCVCVCVCVCVRCVSDMCALCVQGTPLTLVQRETQVRLAIC